jgi:effector-binding domain-containing protein
MYEVTVEDVTAQPTLVVPAATTWAEFPTLWAQLLNDVWGCLRANNITSGCPNVMLYLDNQPHVEVGVLNREQCPPSGRVTASALPAGRVATTVHQGPYSGIGDAHQAVLNWCTEQGIPLSGVRWEVYGPHRQDPTELRTEVYWLVTG